METNGKDRENAAVKARVAEGPAVDAEVPVADAERPAAEAKGLVADAGGSTATAGGPAGATQPPVSEAARQRRGALTDTLYLVVLQGMNQLLPLFVLPYLMYVLGAKGYGYIGFSLSCIQYLMLVVDFGFNFSATKQVARSCGDAVRLNRIFWSVLGAKLLLLAVCTLLMLVLVAVVPTFRLYGKAILCTYPMVVGTAFTFMWMFQGIGKVRQMAVINTLSKLVLLPMIFLFVKSEDDVLLAATLQSSVYVLTALISGCYLWRLRLLRWPRVASLRSRGPIASVRAQFKDSFPLFVSSASSSVYTQLFVVILGFFCAEEAVGRYAAADRVMRCLCFGLFTPLNQAFFPRISQQGATDRPAALASFRLVRNLALLCMALICAFMLFGASFIGTFLGSSYAGIERLLLCMAPVPLFIGLGGVYGLMGLIALGDEMAKRHFRNVYVWVAAAALLLVGTGTPLWGEYGTALAMGMTEALVCVSMLAYFRKDVRRLEPAS